MSNVPSFLYRFFAEKRAPEKKYTSFWLCDVLHCVTIQMTWVAIFMQGGHLGDSTMSNLDAAARPPSPYRPIITSEMPSPTSHAAIGALARLQRPSPVCNDTIKNSLIL